MYTAIFIICLISSGLSLFYSRVGNHKPTKRIRHITDVIGVILFFAGVSAGYLSYMASVDTEKQITEIKTPRLMKTETQRMITSKIEMYSGQKYDMKVFGDVDSLELATSIQSALKEAGWIYTNVYPKHETRRYAETGDAGVFLVSGKGESKRTAESRAALRAVLEEIKLYDDLSLMTPVSCVEVTGPVQKGAKITSVPCSKTQARITGIDMDIKDALIPNDTLVIHVGKQRL